MRHLSPHVALRPSALYAQAGHAVKRHVSGRPSSLLRCSPRLRRGHCYLQLLSDPAPKIDTPIAIGTRPGASRSRKSFCQRTSKTPATTRPCLERCAASARRLCASRVSKQVFSYLIRNPRLQWHLGMFKKEYEPNHRGYNVHHGYYQGTLSLVTPRVRRRREARISLLRRACRL